jgi:hypothetical protein
MHNINQGDNVISGDFIHRSRSESRTLKDFNDPQVKGRFISLAKGEILLPPKLAKKYIDALGGSAEKIELSIREFFRVTVNLERMMQLNLQYQQSYDFNPIDEQSFEDIETEIQIHLTELDRPVNLLLRITRKYGYVIYYPQLKKNLKTLKVSEDDVLTAKELVQRISYIQRYLNENLQFNVIIYEQSEFILDHLLRVRKYLLILRTLCRSLAENTRNSITQIVPGVELDKLMLDIGDS